MHRRTHARSGERHFSRTKFVSSAVHTSTKGRCVWVSGWPCSESQRLICNRVVLQQSVIAY